MNVAVDLRVVNTKTLEVVNTQSLQKQIIGTELSGGYFRLFSDGLVDVNAAERTQEPIQKGVRMVIEQAVFNMLTEMNNLPAQNCARLSTANLETEQETQTAAAPMPVKQRNSNPIVLTPPPALNASRQGENVSIDPNTGEIVRPTRSATSTSNSAAAQQSEVTELKGLFGAGSTPQEPASTSNTTREMQEKLLWGSRPQIR
jgi:hypothetical protein